MIVSVSNDPVTACARFVAAALERAVSARGVASMAVSGGSTAPPLFVELALHAPGWSKVGVWQVDERVAPDGHADRNARQLDALPPDAVRHLMPVTSTDLSAAAERYAEGLPDAFDVVHLGLGGDGHTASWAPSPHPDARAVLASPSPVATIDEFNGRVRMTLGTSVVNAAGLRVVLATGESKAQVVADWVRRSRQRGEAWIDPALPVAAVEPADTMVFLDEAAGSELAPAERFAPTDQFAVDADSDGV
ncbi:MAG: 6-phosphogluconolactonase [Ilumatobacter sp.]